MRPPHSCVTPTRYKRRDTCFISQLVSVAMALTLLCGDPVAAGGCNPPTSAAVVSPEGKMEVVDIQRGGGGRNFKITGHIAYQHPVPFLR